MTRNALSPWAGPLRLLAAGLTAWVAVAAHAAPGGRDAAADYRDLNACMARTMGMHWADHFGVKRVVNDHGVLEPTEAAIDAAPQVVRITELRCRLQLGLQGEDRPEGPP